MPDLKTSGERLSEDPYPPKRSLRVLVANETDAAIDADRFESAIRLAFADSPYQWIEVSVAVVDDDMIRDLNRQFLKHDYPTDVLSFTLEDNPPRLEGEIIVSLDTAVRHATEAGWPASDELLLYVVHGALHLAGYRDKNDEDGAEMRSAEAALLSQLGVVLSPSDSRWTSNAAQEGRLT